MTEQTLAMEDFPRKPVECIKRSCHLSEEYILRSSLSKSPVDRAGSCGLFCFLFNKRIYVGNVGDSRAILSKSGGAIKEGVTVDHKPDDPVETERIRRLGGQIYRTTPKLDFPPDAKIPEIKLPWRVLPGRLSVSRTFGDVSAKHADFEGIPGVISAEPDVFDFEVTDDLDFLVLACDGVFDRLENDYIIDLIWTETRRLTFPDLHTACEYMIHLIFRHSVQKLSYDNISIIFLAFKGFADQVKISRAAHNAAT